jgi:serine protease
MLLLRCTAVTLLAGALCACGGGGGGSGGGSAPVVPPVANLAPTADAGTAQTVQPGVTVVLDASGSSDSDGSISSWAWQQTDGPGVSLEGADQPQASFTAPSPGSTTTLSFSVSVTDDDGASSSASVTVTVEVADPLPTVRISGTLSPPPGQAIDGDTNDPGNRLLSNDDPASPQLLGNPVTLGGYVNEAGAGAEGRSQVAGDPEDYFAVDLLAGQRINLLVAEFRDADADLYLYDSDGELVDFSIETGEVEEITVEAAGRYLVNVSIFSGATNYTLAIGVPLSASSGPSLSGRADLVPWQAVVRYDHRAAATPSMSERLDRDWGASTVAGSGREERLLAMQTRPQPTVLARRLGRALGKRRSFADPAQRARWETLLAIKQLRRQPGIGSAEPNFRVRPLAGVDDPAYAFQWHYPLINLPGAWETSTGAPGVIVAVVDTGILAGHPDLRGQLVDGYDFVRNPVEAGDGDGIDPDPEESVGGSDPAAVNYHGTHVAGTVAARGNNGTGVAGVAFGARIMPLRAITATGGTSYDVRQAVRWAAGLGNDSGTLPAKRADIINLSLGGAGFSSLDQQLYDELRELGIVVVASAGNEGSTLPSYPAAYDNVIAVRPLMSRPPAATAVAT